ncbi:DUF1549 domain-containing protein [Prosthecobacter sp.]|uniref:DUF1549 domain-containing protein n=1 Tax=Prosthecobacter sp. TaxID=1965333 RepID=UPI001D3C4176|nr:DUF1549 domain-containing protein [Prosthecobacter sp.]MCB1279744.1 DUF1549 domain-containing protein [Prosthecobacter sp.]
MNAPLLTSALFVTLGIGCLSAASLPESQKIDQLLAKDWEKAGLKPNPPASDEVLVRRLYLDIAGRIPTVEESQAYLKSSDPQKRAKLIETLLASDGYTSHMFNYWADILRLSDNVKGRLAAEAYEEWLKKQIKDNAPYDQFVRNLLTTDGGVWDSGSIGFWQRDENKLDHLAYTVQVFLGTSIVCAQCHDHPFDKWTQMDYYHMAAFTYGMDTRSKGFNPKTEKPRQEFDKKLLASMTPKERKAYMAKMQADRKSAAKETETASISREDMQKVRQAMQDVMKPLRYTSAEWQEGKLPTLPHDYKYSDAKPGDKVEPKAMFGPEAVKKEGESTLQSFANWMTSPENPRFTTVIANRMWKKAFGIGLIEPVDEITDSTVASNPALMDYLTALMVEKKYSLKSFLRVLYNTDAYQRAATTEEVPLGETYHFTGPVLRRMSAEQIWDSLVTLTRGNVDDAVDAENERLHQYLNDLSMFLGTIKEKGPTGLVEIANLNADKLAANQKKLDEMKAQMAAAKDKGGDTAEMAKKLAREAQQLRKETERDFLVALVGEDRANDLRRGYNAPKPAQQTKRPQLDRKQMASMTPEQRKEFIKSLQKGAGSKDVNLATRASEQPSPARPGTFLRTFGQSDRELIQNASDEASVPQALSLLNGPVADILNSPTSQLNQELAKAQTTPQKLETIYLAFLGRQPNGDEKAILDQVARERGDKAVADVTHALITGSQFLFVQ